MSAHSQFIQQLKDRVSLSSVIGRDYQLYQAGQARYKVRCPFHQERTPSCSVDDQKGFYYCFGCGASGDIFTYVMNTKQLSFGLAVEELARYAGLSVPEPPQGGNNLQTAHNQSQAAAARDEKSQRIVALETAQAWFSQQLYERSGAHALTFLQSRGFNEATLSVFGIGFAPHQTKALTLHLSKQFSLKTLHDCGLVSSTSEAGSRDNVNGSSPPPASSSAVKDFFRHRVMFPINDARGQIVGFGGRYIPPEKEEHNIASGGHPQGGHPHKQEWKPPKYINTKASDEFIKRSLLFNLHRARTEVGISSHQNNPQITSSPFVVVEGYTDVMRLHQIGIKTAVAPLGTAMTPEHWHMLWRYHKSIVLMFDGDSAGKRAMLRAISNALPDLSSDHTLSIALMPDGTDPDSLGRDMPLAVESLMGEAIPMSTFVWRFALHKLFPQVVDVTSDLRLSNITITAEQLAKLEADIVATYAVMNNAVLKKHLMADMNNRLWHLRRLSTRSYARNKGSLVKRRGLLSQLDARSSKNSSYDGNTPPPSVNLAIPPAVFNAKTWVAQEILAVILFCPALAEEYAERLVQIDIPDEYMVMLKKIVAYAESTRAESTHAESTHAESTHNKDRSDHSNSGQNSEEAMHNSDTPFFAPPQWTVNAMLWEHLTQNENIDLTDIPFISYDVQTTVASLAVHLDDITQNTHNEDPDGMNGWRKMLDDILNQLHEHSVEKSFSDIVQQPQGLQKCDALYQELKRFDRDRRPYQR